jgi:hypothetical protein
MSITAAKSGGVRVMVESDSRESPVPAVVLLSQQEGVDLLSMLSFHENPLKGRDLSIFRFGGRLPTGFLQEIIKLGFRIVSVGE